MCTENIFRVYYIWLNAEHLIFNYGRRESSFSEEHDTKYNIVFRCIEWTLISCQKAGQLNIIHPQEWVRGAQEKLPCIRQYI